MSERRSERAKKEINYAKFADPEENDDDFEEFKTQPKKRAKVDPKEADKTKAKPKPEVAASQNGVTDIRPRVELMRLPIEEKVLQRQIKQALEISKSSVDDSKDTNKSEDSDYSNDDSSDESSCSDDDDEEESPVEDLEVKDDSSDDEVKESKKSETEVPKKEVNNSTVTAPSSNEGKPKVAKPIVKKEVSQVKDDASHKITTPKCSSPKRDPPSVSETKKQATSKYSVSIDSNKTLSLLPAKGLRLGLSRKVPRKPLHIGVKQQT